MSRTPSNRLKAINPCPTPIAIVGSAKNNPTELAAKINPTLNANILGALFIGFGFGFIPARE